MSKIILTGDRPTGRLHVGHYVGSLSERVRLQNSGLYDEIYMDIDCRHPASQAVPPSELARWHDCRNDNSTPHSSSPSC